jgi:hypothetical protein
LLSWLRDCGKCLFDRSGDLFFFLFSERKAHPPLGARANDNYRVMLGMRGNHDNRTIPSDCVVQIVRCLLSSFDGECSNRISAMAIPTMEQSQSILLPFL